MLWVVVLWEALRIKNRGGKAALLSRLNIRAAQKRSREMVDGHK